MHLHPTSKAEREQQLVKPHLIQNLAAELEFQTESNQFRILLN